MDLNMPYMNGFEACKRIKNNYEAEVSNLESFVPYIVAVSASNYTADLIKTCK